MNKEFEKIIEKLEERTSFLSDCTKYGNKDAEQQEKSYSTMMMYEVADLVDDLIEIVKQEAKQYNNGWIPCSERMPEEDEKVYISTKTERVYVGVYTKRYGFEKREGFICDDGFMWMNTALAWKPYVLPAPYQPKGE